MEHRVRDGDGQIAVPMDLVNEVRALLSDYGVINELVEGAEWSDEALARHVVAVVQDFNYAPPNLPQKLSPVALFTAAYGSLTPWVTEAAVARALRFGAIRAARNALPYQAGSISYDPNAVWRNYKELGDQMWSEWLQRRDQKKVAMNVDNAWGVAHSDISTRSIEYGGSIISVIGGPL